MDLQAARTARLRDSRLRPPVRAPLPEVDQLGRARARRERPPARDSAARSPPLLEPEAEVYAALVTGTRDYVEKNGFKRVCSACRAGSTRRSSLLIAVDALGADRVTA